MDDERIHRWKHSHAFGQDIKRPGEVRTLIVISITAVMMVIEITAGIAFGSMALLADGLHMTSHTVALSINAFAYVYARKHAHNEKFCFGTGKVNTLGGYTGAVVLAMFALVMVWESLERLISPVEIAFNQAIFVAVLGLLVNGLSVLILGHHHDSNDGHTRHHDHNLWSAYLHVLADALTSLLAIFALLGAKYLGLIWADPVMGLVGAALVARWSFGLLKTTSSILLDKETSDDLRLKIKDALETQDNIRIADLHVWAVGPNIYSAILSVVTHDPQPPEYYKTLMPEGLGIVHTSIEVHRCDN